MLIKEFSPLAAAAILAALSCTSCAIPGVKILSQPIADSRLVGSLLDPDTLTPQTKAYLKEENLQGTYRKNPSETISRLQHKLNSDPSIDLRLSLIELCNDTGSRLKTRSPLEAIGYHLAAADLAFEIGRNRPEMIARHEQLVKAYNFSAGEAATLLFKESHDWSGPLVIEGPWRTYRLQCRVSGDGYFDPSFFDSLVPADRMKFKGIDLERISSPGIGAALVGHREGTEERRAENPHLPPVGMALPVNATLDYSLAGDGVELAFHDLMVTDEAVVAGKKVQLESDLTAPLAFLQNYATERNFAWNALTHPERYLDDVGLYQLEPFRSDQIPVIFVHGLVSSPSVWLTAVNQLRKDPVIRSRYQVFVFRYPTGFPIAFNGATLRRHLSEFQERFSTADNPHMDNLILIGHSMGGVLSSAQIRDSKDTLTDMMFTRPIDDLGGIDDQQKANLKEWLTYESNPAIKRVIFVAAPHRGSEMATGFVGNLGTSLIKFPIEMILSTQTPNIEGLTDLGREIVTNRPDSIQALKPNSPGLTAIMEQPISERVILHSIIGKAEENKSLEESSDGTVPYWSSHLDEAVSEAVFPAKHTPLTRHPGAIEEARRILYLHAGIPYTPNDLQE